MRSDSIWDAVKNTAGKIGDMSIRGLGLAASAVIKEVVTHPSFINNILDMLK